MRQDLKGVDKNTVIKVSNQEEVDIILKIVKSPLKCGIRYTDSAIRLFASDFVDFDDIGPFVGELKMYLDNGFKSISFEDFIRFNTEPAPDLSGQGYDQFWRQYKRPEYDNISRQPISVEEQKINDEIGQIPVPPPVMIPLDEVIKEFKNIQTPFLRFDDLIETIESQREFYAQQPQILLDHTNDLTQQVNALQVENERLKQELAIYIDLRKHHRNATKRNSDKYCQQFKAVTKRATPNTSASC